MFASFGKRITRGFHSSSLTRFAAAQETNAVSTMKLNFSCPRKTIYSDEPVYLVSVFGATGVYGIAADMAPTISELRPGAVVIQKEETSGSETFFVPGGFALTHPGSTTDIAAADIISRDEIDTDLLRKQLESTRKKLESLDDDTQEHTIAQIEMNVYEAACDMMGIAI